MGAPPNNNTSSEFRGTNFWDLFCPLEPIANDTQGENTLSRVVDSVSAALKSYDYIGENENDVAALFEHIIEGRYQKAYKSMPGSPGSQGDKSIYCRGLLTTQSDSSYYEVDCPPFEGSSLEHFGDAEGKFSIGKQNNIYRLGLDGSLRVDGTTGDQWTEVFSNTLQGAYQFADEATPQDSLTSQIEKSFPITSSFLSRYTKIKTDNTRQTGDFVQFDVTMELDIRALEASKFEKFGKYLRGLGDLFSIEGGLKMPDSEDYYLYFYLTSGAEGENPSLRLRFLAKDSSVYPFEKENPDRIPSEEKPIDLGQLEVGELVATMDSGTFHIPLPIFPDFEITLSDIGFRVNYHQNLSGVGFEAILNPIDDSNIKIPGSRYSLVADQVQEYLEVFSGTNDMSEGTSFSFEYPNSGQDESVSLGMQISALSSNNGFGQAFVRLLNNRVYPNKKQKESLLSFLKGGLEAFASDMNDHIGDMECPSDI